jgi:hypothetical protein
MQNVRPDPKHMRPQAYDKDKNIILEITGTKERGTGYIKMSYEAEPEFGAALNMIKADKELEAKKGL